MTSRILAGVLSLVLVPFALAGAQNARDKVPATPRAGIEYNARQFLSSTERNAFKRVYPDFDEPRAVRSWEWKDVDPLGLFSAAENRLRRRTRFLLEHAMSAVPAEEEPAEEQRAFQVVLEKQFDEPAIIMRRRTVKIGVPYTDAYEKRMPVRNLLEKTARFGLQWAQVGGANLYLYNGAILMSRYRSGYVSLADPDIDRPPLRDSRK